jgi:hypothetical protein
MAHHDAANAMVKMAENCERWDGSLVRAESAEHLVADLATIGVLEPA